MNEKLSYEIGKFETDYGKQFTHLIIWKEEKGFQKREVEIIFEKTKNNVKPKELNVFRERWMTLTNAHHPEKLVETMYTTDALYYSNGNLLQGIDTISNEYMYMKNKDYFLKLKPIHVEFVTNEIAFEIGQCSGSYNLPYLLVWNKNKNREWKIYFDSNN